MCNVYRVQPHPAAKTAREAAIVRALRGIEYTAPGGPGVIGLAIKGKTVLRTLTWGIQGKTPAGLKAVNNARDDKLTGPFWRDHWRSGRRCIIPMASYHEWVGAKGQKQKIEVSPLNGGWLFAGGMWADQNDAGQRYTMITTSPNQQLAALHDRMPLFIQPDLVDDWLLADEPPIAMVRPSEARLSIHQL